MKNALFITILVMSSVGLALPADTSFATSSEVPKLYDAKKCPFNSSSPDNTALSSNGAYTLQAKSAVKSSGRGDLSQPQ